MCKKQNSSNQSNITPITLKIEHTTNSYVRLQNKLLFRIITHRLISVEKYLPFTFPKNLYALLVNGPILRLSCFWNRSKNWAKVAFESCCHFQRPYLVQHYHKLVSSSSKHSVVIIIRDLMTLVPIMDLLMNILLDAGRGAFYKCGSSRFVPHFFVTFVFKNIGHYSRKVIRWSHF